MNYYKRSYFKFSRVLFQILKLVFEIFTQHSFLFEYILVKHTNGACHLRRKGCSCARTNNNTWRETSSPSHQQWQRRRSNIIGHHNASKQHQTHQVNRRWRGFYWESLILLSLLYFLRYRIWCSKRTNAFELIANVVYYFCYKLDRRNNISIEVPEVWRKQKFLVTGQRSILFVVAQDQKKQEYSMKMWATQRV